MKKTLRNRRRGQTLVESAMVLVPFLLIMVGVIDIGQVLFYHQSLVDRARAGLRFGITRSFDETAIRNFVRYQTDTPAEGSTALLGLTAENVTVARYDAGLATERIQVSIVNYPYHFVSPWMASTINSSLAVVESLPNEYKEQP